MRGKVPKVEDSEWADTRLADQVLKEIGVYGKFDAPVRTLR